MTGNKSTPDFDSHRHRYFALARKFVCKAFENQLPQPEIGYIQFPHIGGAALKQTTIKEWASLMN
jgi:hypothetical protein